jgi:hypothetical protein
MVSEEFGKKMVTEELGYVDTEELETKSLQKNLEYNNYRRTWIRGNRRT